MRVYMSVDMEGISGVVHWKQTGPGKDAEDYEQCRRLMTGDTSAAAAGAFAGGATAVVVNDSHGAMRNVLLTDLDPRVELVSGSPKPLSMVEGLDSTFQAVFLIGYHSRAGTPGILNHTYSGALVDCRFNGQSVGELGLNAAVAGHFGVPVVLVTGDDVLVTEARALLGDVQAVAVKQAVGRYAARCLHPQRTEQLIRMAAQDAMGNLQRAHPYRPALPLKVDLEFHDTGQADGACLLPLLERTGHRAVSFIAPDPVWAYRITRAALRLSAA
ncbi:MAG TPA: M55 family metallopeptidase [Bacillota bacterium]|nr:M55 family metallopeptidase [Bacillota bacterium]